MVSTRYPASDNRKEIAPGSNTLSMSDSSYEQSKSGARRKSPAGSLEIRAAHELLSEYIEHYESDTFSSFGAKITGLEAELIASGFLARYVDTLIEDSLDGVMITEEL